MSGAPTSATSPRLWFAVAGSPVAWGFQFGIGYWISEAHCNQVASGWTDIAQGLAIAFTAVAALIAVAAGLTALSLYRATSDVDDDDGPPSGRTHFLAIVGMAITPLFFFIIVMNGVGVSVLSPCQQS